MSSSAYTLSGVASYYEHSGKVSFFSAAVGLVLAGAMVLAGSPLYAILLVYNPSVYLGIALPALFSAGIGFGLGFAMRKLGSRNAWVAPALSLGTVGIAYFVSWPFWVATWLWRADGNPLVAFWPPSFIEVLGTLYREGAWTIGHSGGAVSGIALGFVWVCEALMVLTIAPFVAWATATEGVYCESCQRWCVRAPGALRLDPSRIGEIGSRLDRHDLAVLTELPRASEQENHWAEVLVDACNGCGSTHTLLVETVYRSTDAKGRVTLKRTPQVPHLRVSKEQSEWLRRVIAG